MILQLLTAIPLDESIEYSPVPTSYARIFGEQSGEQLDLPPFTLAPLFRWPISSFPHLRSPPFTLAPLPTLFFAGRSPPVITTFELYLTVDYEFVARINASEGSGSAVLSFVCKYSACLPSGANVMEQWHASQQSLPEQQRHS